MSLHRYFAHGMRGSMLEDALEYGSGKSQDLHQHRLSKLFKARKPKTEAHTQTQSNLFAKIPVEIRVQVYELVFDKLGFSGDLHIVRSCVVGHGLRCLRCEPRTDVNDVDSWPAHKLCGTSERHWKYPEAYMDGIISLLRVCQRFHSEATAVLYRRITFHLEHVSTACRFLTLVPPQSIANITSLLISMHVHGPLYPKYFTPTSGNGSPRAFQAGDFRRYLGNYAQLEEKQWLHACGVLHSLSNLSKLRIIVREGEFIVSENKLLKPLMAINVPDFVVRLPWSLSAARDVFDDSKEGVRFKVRRSDENDAQQFLFNPDDDDAVSESAVRRFMTRLLE